MSTDRCDKILSIIDLALDCPDMTRREGRTCWYCQLIDHNTGPSGLCDGCLTKLRDPALSIDAPSVSPTDAENPSILDGPYQHRPAPTSPPPGSWWWRPA